MFTVRWEGLQSEEERGILTAVLLECWELTTGMLLEYGMVSLMLKERGLTPAKYPSQVSANIS